MGNSPECIMLVFMDSFQDNSKGPQRQKFKNTVSAIPVRQDTARISHCVKRMAKSGVRLWAFFFCLFALFCKAFCFFNLVVILTNLIQKPRI